METLKFYDRLAESTPDRLNSGRIFSFSLNLYKDIFNDINSKVDFQVSDTVLDLGGGCGQITAYIAKKCKRVLLVDGAQKALCRAKDNLKKYNNVSYSLMDITRELPNEKFDKIICYSVVHSFKNVDQFVNLIKRLLDISNYIFIGDMPFRDKYKQNLEDRKKNWLKNLILNNKYYLKKYITNFLYKRNKIFSEPPGVDFTKEGLKEILTNFPNIEYKLLPQNRKLPFANSREDLLIIKKQP